MKMAFIVVWFWLVAVSTATAASFLSWLASTLYLPFQDGYIRSRLIDVDLDDDVAAETDLREFSRVCLRRDGCFILRLVSKNASDLVAAELITGLWRAFKDRKEGSSSDGVDDVTIEMRDVTDAARTPASAPIYQETRTGARTPDKLAANSGTACGWTGVNNRLCLKATDKKA